MSAYWKFKGIKLGSESGSFWQTRPRGRETALRSIEGPQAPCARSSVLPRRERAGGASVDGRLGGGVAYTAPADAWCRPVAQVKPGKRTSGRFCKDVRFM